MLEIILELEFLKSEHFRYHWINIKDIYYNKDNEKNGEYNIKSLSKYWNNICLPHNFWKSSLLIIDDLKKIITQWGRNSWAITLLIAKYIAKKIKEEASVWWFQ